ncbi:MAG: hypothetical protein ACEQSR_08585 [Candidatus Methylacidiphilales bacterium]
MNSKLYNILKDLVNVGISDKLYLAQTIFKDKKELVVYIDGKEFKHIGYEDIRCRTAYIRQIGEVDLKPINMGGCGNSYSQIYQYRLVVYEKNFDGNSGFFTKLLLSNLRDKEITLKKIWEQSRSLFNSENPFNNVELMPNQLFVAIDFTFEVKPGCGCDVKELFCKKENNIICK